MVSRGEEEGGGATPMISHQRLSSLGISVTFLSPADQVVTNVLSVGLTVFACLSDLLSVWVFACLSVYLSV